MAVVIQIRRDGASNWSSANPTLAQGELGFETDTKKFKVGDGLTAWNALGYKDEIENLVDVNITSLADNQILVYNSATSKWKNESAATALTDNMPVSMPSSGVAFQKSDGTSSILSETGGVATLDNVQLGSSVTGIGGNATQYFELSLTNDAAGNLTELNKLVAAPSDTVSIDENNQYYIGASMDFQIINNNLVIVI
tara:strand:+ start:591 stop:1181 length:591 start_codon:yes stop_codon:yes gene_type:complete